MSKKLNLISVDLSVLELTKDNDINVETSISFWKTGLNERRTKEIQIALEQIAAELAGCVMFEMERRLENDNK